MGRTRPNIIITGTPGVGKTSHAALLAAETGLRHLCVSEFAIEQGCCSGWDEQLKTWVVDDDALADKIGQVVDQGGNVIDWHGCDLFEEDDIDLVMVLRASTNQLFDRLTARGYPQNKIDENIDSEIMMVVLEEAQEGYPSEMVVVCDSDGNDQMRENVDRLKLWLQNWTAQNGQSS